MAVLAHHWQRRLPWYPGDWIWPVLLGLVIAALAAAGAILSLSAAAILVPRGRRLETA